jgi:hypothetical protein
MKPCGGNEGTGGKAEKFVGTNSFEDTDRPRLLPKDETVLSSSYTGGNGLELVAAVGGGAKLG